MASPSRRSASAPSVLLVDDSRDTREMYSEYLSLNGFTVTAAGEGAGALRVAIASPPDVVVTDIVLPGDVDGLELMRRLRADDRTKHVPIIVLSGREIGGDRDEAEGCGCDLYLIKPCLPDKLVSELRRIIKDQ